jgi:hypothetical protein
MKTYSTNREKYWLDILGVTHDLIFNKNEGKLSCSLKFKQNWNDFTHAYNYISVQKI